MKRKLKLMFVVFSLLIVAALTLIRMIDPGPLREMRFAAFDQYQRLKPRDYQPVPVRIVDIDERSLREFGQWPWPRSRVAELLARLKDLGAAAVAFDVLFSEPDRLSPRVVLENVPGLDPASIPGLPDNDEVLARQIAQQPTVLGIASARDGAKLPPPKAGFAYIGESPVNAPPAVTGAVLPLPVLAEAAQGLGDISMNSEQENAVVRVMPMFMSDGVQLVPSLAMEALRVAQGASTFVFENTSGTDTSMDGVKVGDFEVPTTRSGGLVALSHHGSAGTLCFRKCGPHRCGSRSCAAD